MWSAITRALYIIEWSSGIDRTMFFITENTSVITLATFHLPYFIISTVTNTIFNAHKIILISEILSILED